MERATKPLDEDREPGRGIGQRVDRYLVLERIGEGGAGEVFAAFDPVLDRKVAVKLLRGEGRANALVREGRMLARLSHPNVVAIHDVGVHEGRAYLAMELVEGDEFDRWCTRRREQGRWHEIVAALVDVGRGLAAAHRANVVHGDVKPSNVLIDRDERVRVSDFGIARIVEEEAAANDAEEHRRPVGTPAFMAPEQHDLLPPDARSDQYSFSLMAWEALCGSLPFADDAGTTDIEGTTGYSPAKTWGKATFGTVEALALAKHEPVTAAASTPAPARIVSALRRGLSPNPAERWADMDALLSQLTVERQGRRWWYVGGAIIVTAATTLAIERATAQQADPVCAGSEEHLQGVWDPTVRQSVQTGFADTGLALANEVWPLVRDRLDAYAQSWTQMHRSTCEATNVRKEQSAEVMDLRMACLQRAKVALASTAKVLADADAGVIEAAPDVASSLPPLSRCEDVTALQVRMPEPSDPDTAAAVASARERLSEVRALMKVGRHERALELAEQVREQTASVDYAPLRTETELLLASLHLAESTPQSAETVGTEALDFAVRTGQWRHAADIAVTLTSASDRLEKVDQAMIYARLAAGLSHRPPADDRTRARALHARAVALDIAGKYEESLRADLDALALAKKVYRPDEANIAVLHANLVNRYANLGRFGEGEDHARAAIEGYETAYGAKHPKTNEARMRLAMLAARQGRLEEAETIMRQALEFALDVRPPHHFDVQLARDTLGNTLRLQGRNEEAAEQFRLELEAIEQSKGRDTIAAAKTLSNLASAWLDMGRHDDAIAAYQEALDTALDKLGEKHADTGSFYQNLGNALADAGRYKEARTALQRGLQLQLETLGPDHLAVARTHFNLAGTLAALRDFEGAEEGFRRALEIRRAMLSSDHPTIALSKLGLGTLLLDRGRSEDARELLEAAWQTYQKEGLPADERGGSAFALARVLEKEGEHERAASLAATAREAFSTMGEAGADRVAEVDAWSKP